MTDPPTIDAQGKHKRATGPRTNAGKRRSSRNASRHDLSTPVRADPRARTREDRWRTFLLAPTPMPGRREQAAAVADAQIDFMRVRAAKVGILERMFQVGSLQYHESTGTYAILHRLRPIRSIGCHGAAVSGLAGQDSAANKRRRSRRLFSELQKLERYERRAFSRRKFALRTFGGFSL
jgi:hypothetical protein